MCPLCTRTLQRPSGGEPGENLTRERTIRALRTVSLKMAQSTRFRSEIVTAPHGTNRSHAPQLSPPLLLSIPSTHQLLGISRALTVRKKLKLPAFKQTSRFGGDNGSTFAIRCAYGSGRRNLMTRLRSFRAADMYTAGGTDLTQRVSDPPPPHLRCRVFGYNRARVSREPRTMTLKSGL